jgi:hypothetical protein
MQVADSLDLSDLSEALYSGSHVQSTLDTNSPL